MIEKLQNRSFVNYRYSLKMSFISIFCLIFLLFLSEFLLSSSSERNVFIIPVTGEVGPGMSAFIDRAIKEADQSPDSIFVLEMDTFGGRVDSALQIVETLLNAPQGETIAFVRDKAISAGALIALACNKLVMRPNTTIGDCAPITYSSEGPQIMGEKFQSPLRAKFRTLARRNGYPAALAESMVTEEMEVYQIQLDKKTVYMDSQAFADLSKKETEKISSKKTIVAKGELLTMDDAEAFELGFSSMTAGTIEEMLSAMNVNNSKIIRFEQNWSETLGIFISSISPILLMIGMAALYTELKAPGFGLPGLIGIACLGLVFLNQYLIGLADHTELILIVLGILLLAMEFFVFPGFGIAGIAGLVVLGVGLILSFQDFVLPDPGLPWQKELLTKNIIQVLGSFLFAFVFSLFFLRYIFPRVGRVVQGPYLDTALTQSRAESEESKKLQPGDTGMAVTFLRPSGKAKFGIDVFDVVSEGDFLDKDTKLVVKAIEGNRIIVGKKEMP